MFDATCPLVTKVHMEVARLGRIGRSVSRIGALQPATSVALSDLQVARSPPCLSALRLLVVEPPAPKPYKLASAPALSSVNEPSANAPRL